MDRDLDDQYLGTLTKTLSIKIDYRTLAKMDYLMRHYKFTSRSDFVRKAIMFKICRIRGEDLISGR